MLGTVYYVTRHYRLGDVQISQEKLWDMLADKRLIAVRVWGYFHGSITLAAGDTNPFPDHLWDSALVGVVAVPRAKVRALWNIKRITPKIRRQVKDVLCAEVAKYSERLSAVEDDQLRKQKENRE